MNDGLGRRVYRVRGMSQKRWQAVLCDLKKRTGRAQFAMEELEAAYQESVRRYGIDPEGPVGFIHGDLGEPCTDCGGVNDVLCDYPVGNGKTCDRKICEECSPPVAPNLHYCKPHRAEWERFKSTDLCGTVFAQFAGPDRTKPKNRRTRKP